MKADFTKRSLTQSSLLCRSEPPLPRLRSPFPAPAPLPERAFYKRVKNAGG